MNLLNINSLQKVSVYDNHLNKQNIYLVINVDSGSMIRFKHVDLLHLACLNTFTRIKKTMTADTNHILIITKS